MSSSRFQPLPPVASSTGSLLRGLCGLYISRDAGSQYPRAMLQRQILAFTRLMSVTLENSRHACRQAGVPRLPRAVRMSPKSSCPATLPSRTGRLSLNPGSGSPNLELDAASSSSSGMRRACDRGGTGIPAVMGDAAKWLVDHCPSLGCGVASKQAAPRQ